MAKIRLVSYSDGMRTPFDGQYVVEYDPTREGVDPEGRALLAHLVCTPNRNEALDLPADAAFELWRKAQGFRKDGCPNRPLTAFNVEIS